MKSFVRNVWTLTAPYWKSEEKKLAYLLLATIIGLNLGEVYLNVLFNKWNNDFYDALQALKYDLFVKALFRFSYLAVTYIVIVVYKVYINQMLQIRWRRWLTGSFLRRWLDRQNYYRMQLAGKPSDNPDQRISEDVGQFIDLTLGLCLGLLSSVVTLFSFLFILWKLSGDMTIPLVNITIPGYMVWAAMVYAIVGTWLTSKLGRPLILLNFDQQRFEADFRFALVRFRENTERIALYKGEKPEQENFIKRFSSVFDNYWAIMKRQKTLTWFTSGYYQIAIIFPFLVAAPRYFAKQIQLGGLMQTSSAFGQVQGSFSYIISAYTSIATWKAVVSRLDGFTTHIAEAETLKNHAFTPNSASGEKLTAEKLSIKLPDGSALLNNINLSVAKGDRMLISGPSGSGKSTLLRTLAGIWPYANGNVSIPADATTLFLPQMPYLPLGPLRHVLTYPYAPASNDETLRQTLALCHLEHLSNKLDESSNWALMLSPGEQQRIAFARAILAQPDFVFLDEATSALDEPAEAQLYKTLKERLPKSAIVSVGHRHTLKAWHDKTLDLE